MTRYPRLKDITDQVDASGSIICRNCSTAVQKPRRHYCSDACMDEFNRNNSWFFVRKDILRRDSYRCSICKKRFRKKDLDVDHIIPLKMGGQPFEKANLRTLCKGCHKLKTDLDRWANKAHDD